MKKNWKIKYFDTFDHASGVAKEGQNLNGGFFYLWEETLRESIQNIFSAKSANGKNKSGKGFVTYQLLFDLENKNVVLEIPIEKYLDLLAKMRLKFFINDRKFGFLLKEKLALKKIAKLHCKYFLQNNELEFYKKLSELIL